MPFIFVLNDRTVEPSSPFIRRFAFLPPANAFNPLYSHYFTGTSIGRPRKMARISITDLYLIRFQIRSVIIHCFCGGNSCFAFYRKKRARKIVKTVNISPNRLTVVFLFRSQRAHTLKQRITHNQSQVIVFRRI